jgi:hypothetical protein
MPIPLDEMFESDWYLLRAVSTVQSCAAAGPSDDPGAHIACHGSHFDCSVRQICASQLSPAARDPGCVLGEPTDIIRVSRRDRKQYWEVVQR